jgi:acetyl-CoA carboxylase biotin carboxyl carrier protein
VPAVNFDQIERLMRLMAETDLAEVEIRQGGVHVRISRQPAPLPAPLPPTAPASAPVSSAPAAAATPPVVDEDAGLHVVRATMVGTFYRRPNPEAPPFAKEGEVVRKGQVICILEAMKILNEIECDVSGTIVRILAEDGQPVEFGEKLFAIRPA